MALTLTVVEHYRLTQARLEADASWARELLERLRAGEYWLEREPNRPWNNPEVVTVRVQTDAAERRRTGAPATNGRTLDARG